MRKIFLLFAGLLPAVSLAAQVVSAPPAVLSASIENGATGVNAGVLVYPGLSITFSEPMNGTTYDVGTLSGPNGSCSCVPLYPHWNASDTILTFTSGGNYLRTGTTLTFTLNTNGVLKGANGQSLASGYTLSFTTTPVPVVKDIPGVTGGTGMAMDASGNFWIADQNPVSLFGTTYNGALTELSPSGDVLGNFDWGINTGLIAFDQVGPSPVAIDASGDIWEASAGFQEFNSVGQLSFWDCVTNPNNPGTNCLTTPRTGGLVADSSGDVWAAIPGNGTPSPDYVHRYSNILELTVAHGLNVCVAGSYPDAITIDKSGNIWVANEGNGTPGTAAGDSNVMELSPDCTVLGTYVAGPEPDAIAIDHSEDVWVANWGTVNDSVYGQHSSVTELVPSGGTYTPHTYFDICNPGAMAIDAAGDVWLFDSNCSGGVGPLITELNPSGQFINTYWPANGYLNPNSDFGQGDIVIDSADNVWVTNSGESSPNGLMEFVGIAKGAATVTLSNLNQTYSGYPEPVTVTTNPAGLAVSVAYDGSTSPPVQVGTYDVVATVTAPGYTGSATGTLTISVAPSPVQIVVTSSLAAVPGGGYQATIDVADTGGSSASNVNLISATLGSTTGSPLPQSLGTIAGGGFATATVTFPAAAGAPGTLTVLRIGGTYSGGTFSSGKRVRLP